MITIVEDDLANLAVDYTVALSLMPNAPATLTNTTVRLSIAEDPALLSLSPSTLTLEEGSTAELTISSDLAPPGLITAVLMATGEATINIEPSTITLGPSTPQTKVTIRIDDDDIPEPEQTAIIHLTIVSGPGRVDSNYQQTEVTVPLSDPLPNVAANFIPPTVTTTSHGLDEGQQAMLVVTADRISSPATLSLTTTRYLALDRDQVTLTSDQTTAVFIITALVDKVITTMQRSDTIVLTLEGNISLSPFEQINTALYTLYINNTETFELSFTSTQITLNEGDVRGDISLGLSAASPELDRTINLKLYTDTPRLFIFPNSFFALDPEQTREFITLGVEEDDIAQRTNSYRLSLDPESDVLVSLKSPLIITVPRQRYPNHKYHPS